MLHPPLLLNMIQIHAPPRIRIPMRRRQDTPPAQLQRLLLAQIIPILSIQHAVRERLAGPDAEQIPRQPRAVRVDVVQRRPLLRRDARAHSAHRQAHAFVRVYQVREDLRRRGHGDALLVAELVEAALHPEVGEPVLAILGAGGCLWGRRRGELRLLRWEAGLVGWDGDGERDGVWKQERGGR